MTGRLARTAKPQTPPVWMLIITVAIATMTGTEVAAQAAEAEIDEFIVTAQKREQSLGDLGFAITALDAQDLTDQRILAFENLAKQIPSLELFRGNGSNNATITLRGIGTTNPWVNNNPSVSAHADGVYWPMSAYLTFPIFDMERIEVLKGPQVGLYGRNSTAGAINFVSQRPDEDASGYVDVAYGSYDAIDVKAALGGQLGDTVSGRLAALYRSGGGYMDRPGTIGSTAGFTRVPGTVPGVAEVPARSDYGDRDVFALRGSLKFAPTERFEAFASVHFSDDQSEIVGSTNINGDVLGVFQPPNDDPFNDYDNVEPLNDSEQLGGVLELRWRFDDTDLISITGYETLDRQYNIGDFVPIRVAEASFAEELESFYQEFRLDYQPGSDLRWLVGLMFTDDDIEYSRVLTAYDLILGSLGTSFVQQDESFAAYTQLEWRFADAWQLTGSLRYTDEEKRYDGGSFEIDPFGVSAVGSVFPNVVPDGLFDQRTYEDDDVSGSLWLQWEPSDEQLYFFNVSRAFKSGGFDGSGITEPASFTPYGAETVWAYEAGSKLKLLQDRMFLAASLFFYDYSDKQVLSLQDLGGGIVEAIIQNAAESEIYGLDLELDWLLAPSLTLLIRGTWLDSEITGWDSADPAEVADRLGNKLPGTPELSMTAGLNWETQMGDNVLGLRIWGTYADEAFRDIENTEQLLSDSYSIVSARVSLAGAGNWSVYLFGDNIFDEEYVTSTRSLVGMLGRYYGPPRTFGVGFRYNFFE